MDLVVDLGQSGARFKIDHQVTNLEFAKNSAEPITKTLTDIFQRIPKGQFENVYLSLTGLQGNVGDQNPYGEIAHQYFQAKRVWVMDDGIASYVGAIGDRSGIVLTLGGGVVAISFNAGKFGHSDGKGPIFGDFGGGFWVGQMAMQQSIATIDGRNNENDLVDLLKEELRLYANLADKTGVDASRLCITAAKTVAMGAAHGVKAAEHILDLGAQYLSSTINSAWHKVKDDKAELPVLSIRGGLSKSDLYVSKIQNYLKEKMDFQYMAGLGDHLDGAPQVAKLFPNGAPPLMKLWSA